MDINNLANCTKCGKIYQRNAKGLCVSCLRELDRELDDCIDFLRKNKQCNMEELSSATGVPQRHIMIFIMEGRLITAGNPNITYPCDVCGKPIKNGKMCDSCRNKLAKQARDAFSAPGKKESGYPSTYKARDDG